MYVMEDCTIELERKKERLSDDLLSSCVTPDVLAHERFEQVYVELNGESCFDRNWRGLAGKLLKPQPSRSTIERLSKSDNSARELLETWEEQCDGSKTYDFLIATMLGVGVYSACDELLDFLESCQTSLRSEVKQEGIEDLEEIVSLEVDGAGETKAEVNTEILQRSISLVESEQQQQQQATGSRVEKRTSRNDVTYERAQSCPADPSFFRKIRKFSKKIFRSNSTPVGVVPALRPDPIPPQPSGPPPPPEDEIFVVSSDVDNQTHEMQRLMSFVHNLRPVNKGLLTVKTIHDSEQHGQMMTTWLEERVNRARYVIVCCSSILKQIVDEQTNMPRFNHQIDYNLKFALNFLVTGVIYGNGCRNPKGKYIPILLPEHDSSNLLIPLCYFMTFNWPNDEKKILNYIMNRPDHPVPKTGEPKRLVRRTFCS